MTKEERDKICLTCVNHKNDARYGILCGLTNNIANFQVTCKDYKKEELQPIYQEEYRSKPDYKRKSKKGIGSFLGVGISLWLIFKLIVLVIKFFKT